MFSGNDIPENASPLCQAYAGPGDEVLHTEHGFSLYPILAKAAGATPIEVPDFEAIDPDQPVEDVLEQIRQRLRTIHDLIYAR